MFYKKKRVNWYLPALLAGPNGITQLPLFCFYLVFEFGYHSKDEIGIEKCKCKPMHLVEDQEQVKDPTFMRTFYRHEWGAFYLIMPMLEIRKATYWYCTGCCLGLDESQFLYIGSWLMIICQCGHIFVRERVSAIWVQKWGPGLVFSAVVSATGQLK